MTYLVGCAFLAVLYGVHVHAQDVAGCIRAGQDVSLGDGLKNLGYHTLVGALWVLGFHLVGAIGGGTPGTAAVAHQSTVEPVALGEPSERLEAGRFYPWPKLVQIPADGSYRVQVFVVTEGTPDSVVTCSAFVDGERTDVSFARRLGLQGDSGASTATGLLDLDKGQMIGLRCKTDQDRGAITLRSVALLAVVGGAT